MVTHVFACGQNDEMTEYNMNEGVKDTLVVANNEIKYDATIELDLNETYLKSMPMVGN